MNPNTDKLVRRTTMVATATASYFLLTADYGPEPNALDPVSIFSRNFQLNSCIIWKKDIILNIISTFSRFESN